MASPRLQAAATPLPGRGEGAPHSRRSVSGRPGYGRAWAVLIASVAVPWLWPLLVALLISAGLPGAAWARRAWAGGAAPLAVPEVPAALLVSEAPTGKPGPTMLAAPEGQPEHVATAARPVGPGGGWCHVATGKASWYQAAAGSRTTSGERWNPRGLTAASTTLPLGTRLLVINRITGKQAEVRVNDRGNFARLGRVLDLTPAAFERLAAPHAGLVDVDLYVER